MYSAFIPGEAPKKIFNCIGMNVSKAKIEDNKLKAWGKELTYYLDPKTGEKLTTWDNPWTGEKNLPGKKERIKRYTNLRPIKLFISQMILYKWLFLRLFHLTFDTINSTRQVLLLAR